MPPDNPHTITAVAATLTINGQVVAVSRELAALFAALWVEGDAILLPNVHAIELHREQQNIRVLAHMRGRKVKIA